MKEYQRETIQKTVNEINKNMFLPDIQRPFVWEEEKIYKLFDSLMRGYPISTFLYWELSREEIDDLKVKMYRFVDSNDKDSELVMSLERDKYSLILDGQQRLTSLYISLKGVWDEKVRNSKLVKELYFNVLSGDTEDEEGVQYEFCFLPRQYGLTNIENGNANEANVKLWINVKRIFESDLGKSEKRKMFVRKIVEDNPDIKKYEDKIDDNIDKFDEVLKEHGVINYYPEDEDKYEKVLDIFVRTNSGGTKLGYSDLLFSRMKFHWDAAREEFNALIDEINRRNFEFDTDFILKTSLMIFSTKAEEIRYNNINNLSANLVGNVRDNWPKICGSVKATAGLLEQFLITDKKILPSYNALIPIIYWIFRRDRQVFRHDSDTDRKELLIIRVWLIKALLSGTFGGQADTVLYKCKEAIDSSASTVYPAEEIQKKIMETKNRSMDIREDKFDQIRYRSKESYTFLSLCYKSAINFQPIIKGNLPEQDHIFSKHELEQASIHGEKINSIYNIRFVTLTDNRAKSKTPFSDWVESLKESRQKVFETHLIPEGLWTVKDFDKFLSERKRLMLANLDY